jgi:hypothetical protein
VLATGLLLMLYLGVRMLGERVGAAEVAWTRRPFVIVASALAYGAGNIATKLVSEGIDHGAWILVVDGIPLIVGLALIALGAIAVTRTRAVSVLAVG